MPISHSLLRQVNLLGEGVQVLHQRGHDLGQARVDVLAHAGVDGVD